MLTKDAFERRVLAYMGHLEGRLSKELQPKLQRCISRVRRKVRPNCLWKVYDKKEAAQMLQGKDLVKHFSKASHVVIFTITLGSEMDTMIEEGKSLSTVDELIYEAIGSAFVEEALEGLRNKLEEEWEHVGSSFSPGYGDCPLHLHRDILELVDPSKNLGVRLNKHYLLVPRKTITGFIPLSKNNALKSEVKCGKCNFEDCCSFHSEKVIIFDGGLGTELQAQGFKSVENLASLNLSHPDSVLKAHRAYVEAGAQYISTNTFSANALKVKDKDRLDRMITRGVQLAKKADPQKVFLDIGPLGVLMKPQGTFTFEKAYKHFQEVINIGMKEGVDGILLETFTDLYEVKAAIYAAKELTKLPVYATMSFEKTGRTFLGLEPKVALRALEAFGADVVGINCSVGPREMIPWLKDSIPYLSKPVMVQGNAGLPISHGGEDRFPLSPKDYGAYTKLLQEIGVKIIGGCCGTSPETIKEVTKNIQENLPPSLTKRVSLPFTCSYNEGLFIDGPTVVGERINPTGKEPIEKALQTENYSTVIQEALLQKKEGAEILDINVGMPGIKEDKILPEIIEEIQQVVSVPLQIDTSDGKALEKALRIYNGVPIINSVNGSEDSLKTVLPLGKKYGCSMIALTFDDEGLPKTAKSRVEIAKKIILEAKKYGIAKEQLIFDPLALTIAHEPEQAKESLRALGMIKKETGCKTVLGLSNISYGMPYRSKINKSFLTLALYEGLDLLLMDPGDNEMQEALHSFNLLSNNNLKGKGYGELFLSTENKKPNSKKEKITWKSVLLDGDYRAFEKVLIEWIDKHPTDQGTYEKFIEEELLYAFDQIGSLYDEGHIYLPQLIQSAEVLKSGLQLLKDKSWNGMCYKSGKKEGKGKGKILLATVEGDLHDIGKNIFRILVENYGYGVTDLGKDVKSEVILAEMEKGDYSIVGLSALMTTTLDSMKNTVQSIRKLYPECKTIVGGAVLTETFSKSIGADAYAKDARAGVEWVKKWTDS